MKHTVFIYDMRSQIYHLQSTIISAFAMICKWMLHLATYHLFYLRNNVRHTHKTVPDDSWQRVKTIQLTIKTLMTQTIIEAYRPESKSIIKASNLNCAKENGDTFCILSMLKERDYMNEAPPPACSWESIK